MNVLLPLVLVLSPIKMESARFTISQEGKRIGTEEFSIVQRQEGYLVEGRTRIGDMSISSRMELDQKLVPTSYEYSNPQGAIRVKVAEPVSELQSVAGGETSSVDFRFPTGGVILDNNFFHHYLILLYRVEAGQNLFSAFVPQEMKVGSASVRSTGPRTYDLDVGDVRLQATTDADGRLIKLAVPSAKVIVER